MLLAHLFLHDYRLQVSLTNTATGAASLAAAIFASVVTASRLGSQLHVFSQVLIHLQCDIVQACSCYAPLRPMSCTAKPSAVHGAGVAQPGGVPDAAISAALTAATGLKRSRYCLQLSGLQPIGIIATRTARICRSSSFCNIPVSILAGGDAVAVCECLRPMGCRRRD
jgi:hypothetical protein